MKLSYVISNFKSISADAIAVFIAEDKLIFEKQITSVKKHVGKGLDRSIATEEFKGKDSDVLSYLPEKMKTKRILLIGIGEQKKFTAEKMRRAAAKAAKKVQSLKGTSLAIFLPDLEAPFTMEEAVRGIFEGAVLSLYKYDKYFTEEKEKNKKLTSITLFSEKKDHEKEIRKAIVTAKIVCEAVTLARDLENAPSNEIYPESLAEVARMSAKQYGYRAEVWDKKRIEREEFGGLLAVNSGSVKPPRFVILEHNSGRRDLNTIVLVGKGITFDTGGISIKPAANMAEMKMDMSGAAAVIGTMEAAARLKIPVHLVGLIPTTENMPSGSAMKPGDIIVHYGGKTSEVDNTDAEGRLVLADALAYAGKYKPAAVIDLATLTGAVVVALGHHATGMMGNDDELMMKLKTAGEKTFERVWELPLYEEYEKLIKSDVADVKNTGGRWGGAITAGLFLKKFIGNYKWVHLDIAGTAILEEDLPYTPRGGSGVGVRLLVEFLKNWAK